MLLTWQYAAHEHGRCGGEAKICHACTLAHYASCQGRPQQGSRETWITADLQPPQAAKHNLVLKCQQSLYKTSTDCIIAGMWLSSGRDFDTRRTEIRRLLAGLPTRSDRVSARAAPKKKPLSAVRV